MLELTDDQKIEAQKVMDQLMAYWWSRIVVKMEIGLPFRLALQELMQEIMSDA